MKGGSRSNQADSRDYQSGRGMPRTAIVMGAPSVRTMKLLRLSCRIVLETRKNKYVNAEPATPCLGFLKMAGQFGGSP